MPEILGPRINVAIIHKAKQTAPLFKEVLKGTGIYRATIYSGYDEIRSEDNIQIFILDKEQAEHHPSNLPRPNAVIITGDKNKTKKFTEEGFIVIQSPVSPDDIEKHLNNIKVYAGYMRGVGDSSSIEADLIARGFTPKIYETWNGMVHDENNLALFIIEYGAAMGGFPKNRLVTRTYVLDPNPNKLKALVNAKFTEWEFLPRLETKKT